MLRPLKWIGLALAAASLCGCASLTRAVLIPKFKIDVAAQPLKDIPAPETASPIAAPESASTAEPTLATATIAPAPEPAAPPVRTDIQGAGDHSMKIDRVVITGAKPLPHRAPNYSPEQVAAMVCTSARIGFGGKAAKRAHAVTLAARDARADLEAGRITQKQADDIEMKRQDAVHAFMTPIPLLSLLGVSPAKKNDLPPQRYQGVVIEDTDLYTFKENGKPVMAVSGVLRNTGKTRVELPPLTLRALDDWGFVLAGQSSLVPFEALEPGEAKAFELRFLNPPEYTGEVYVHFAPPFMYRAPRDCDFFDPATFDPDKPLGDVTQPVDSLTAPKLSIGGIRRFIADSGPHAGATTADYTAAELNVLTQHYRGASAEAWRCHHPTDSGGRAERCSNASQRLGWRDMFAMAEAIDEAQGALRAAEEAKAALTSGGSQTEADAAERVSTAAIARFRAMGDAALARAGGSIPGVALELSGSTLGYDGKVLYVDVAGTMRNTGSAPAKVDALMIAAVDRFGLPLLSLTAPYDTTLAAGTDVAFSQHIPINSPPPRLLDWSVRVGAMGRARTS
ncbi:MAG: FxLYD domain-containing protein [Alphaproteobacteria bacterium]